MDNQNTKSVKLLGYILIAISSFIIFSNSMAAIAILLVGGIENSEPVNNIYPSAMDRFQTLLFSNIYTFCFFFISLGIFLLIGAINIIKSKKWACNLLRIGSIVYLVIICIFIIIFLSSVYRYEDFWFITPVLIFMQIVPSAILAGIAIYLSQNKIKEILLA